MLNQFDTVYLYFFQQIRYLYSIYNTGTVHTFLLTDKSRYFLPGMILLVFLFLFFVLLIRYAFFNLTVLLNLVLNVCRPRLIFFSFLNLLLKVYADVQLPTSPLTAPLQV
jgi:hypothetical protein